MLVWILAILLFFLTTDFADAQEPQFNTSLISVVRAATRGEAKKALLFYEKQASHFEALAKSGESSNQYWSQAARAYREASNAAHFSGNLHKAIVYGEKALALSEQLDNRRLKLASLSSLVWAHRRGRNFAKAEELTEFGFKIAQEWPANSLDWIWWHGVFYLYRAQEFRRRQQFNKTVEAYEQSIRLHSEFVKTIPGTGREIEDRKDLARNNMLSGYGGRGEAYLSMGKNDEAWDAFQRGLEATEEWKLEFYQSRFYVGLGDVLRRRNDFIGSMDRFHTALELGRRQQRPDVIGIAAGRIGDVLRDTGKKTEAIVFYREAIQQIESIRSLLGTENTRQAYFGGWLGAYWGVTQSLWDTGAHDEAFHFGERVRSRALLDMLGTKIELTRIKNTATLGLSELSNPEDSEYSYRAFFDKVRKIDPEQASLMTVEPLNVTQVQALLEPGQALLEYLVTPRKTYLWVIDKNRSHALVLPVLQKDLAAKVQASRGAISEFKPLKDYQTLARDLYQHLIAPATSLIDGKELIIVPHDVLHYLPFQALYSARGRYLVEDHSVTYLSSASLMQFTKAKRKAVGEKILAVGNPSFEFSKVNLPMSELEVDEIRRLYPRSAGIAKADASEEKVKTLAPDYDVLHFATHAELNKNDPLSSAILLATGGRDDGRLQVREIFAMDLKASLVVLSGCETGLGQLSSGDELVGLTRAFIYAGTPSVVASLWKVDDASTAQLMSGFYRNLKSKTKVESLRQAQLDMIRGKASIGLLAQRGVGGVGKLGQSPAGKSSDSIPTSHPYFWAPFILVGDGK
jgi:CHAT domain-containing protein